MKRILYIWFLSFAVLFMGQQAIAQRGHRSGHSSKQHHKVSKKYNHHRSKAYKHYNKSSNKHYSKGHNKYYSKNRNKHYQKHYKNRSHGYANRSPKHYSHSNRNRYGHRSAYGRRIANAPRYHHRRVVPWGVSRHYKYNHHVYFPDYHTFYDARRGGYVYRHGGRWIFTQAMPSFLVGINWNRARVEYMNNVPMNAYPQNYYDDYNRRYPSVAFSLNVAL